MEAQVDSRKLNDWMQVIGIFAVVASLVFVGLQIRQDQEIAIVESMSLRFDHAESLANLVEQNRDTWVKGLDGGELSKEETAVFYAIAEVAEMHFAILYFRFARIGPDSPEAASRDWAYALYQYPSLRQFYVGKMEVSKSASQSFDLPSGGRDDFRASVDTYLIELDGGSAHILSEMDYIIWQ